jgi:signal transduction histidine kinase
MALLYAALVSVVRYAERIIRAQHEAIRQRNASLETLSARMLRNQEEEKRKIAFDLHEGIAQTLSAVKLSVESTCDALRRGGQDGAQLAPAVKVVKEAISEVRTVALHLRPSSLDELGLLATIKWYCREFARLRPQVCADCDIGLQEKDLPEALKIIIYRVLEEICRAAGTLPDMRRLRVGLTQDEDRIVLSVSHDGMPAQAPGDADPELALARERTLLSGGSFEAMAGEADSRTLRAAWLR